jgi:two-component system, OmpR family, response regulator
MSTELRHILCVDDDDDILEVTKLCLESIGGFRVTSRSGGADIVSVTEREKPDLILLDVMMPGVDGPSTLKLLQQATPPPRVPVVFMTARVQPTEVSEYLGLGAVGVVAKPFDPMRLSEQVASIWQTWQDARVGRGTALPPPPSPGGGGWPRLRGGVG